jgi:poly-beta-1,6-N-acetyl-D-glucosamine synthase
VGRTARRVDQQRPAPTPATAPGPSSGGCTSRCRGSWRWRRRSLDLLIPALDVAYSLVWLPGLPLAATGRFWIVGPYTVAVLPLTLLVNAILYRYQRRRVFHLLGLRVRRNTLGLVAFVLTYQILMSPVSVAGYVQELLGLRRRWK